MPELCTIYDYMRTHASLLAEVRHGTVGFSFLMPSKNGKCHACNATCENHDVV